MYLGVSRVRDACGAVVLSLVLVVSIPHGAIAADDAIPVAAEVTTTIRVLDNDGLTDAAQVTEITKQPQHGTAKITADGKAVDYTPTAGFAGSDSFAYVANDATANKTATGTVTIGVAVLRETGVRISDIQLNRIGGVLLILFVLAVLLEIALHTLFDWKVFIERFEDRGLKTPIAVAVALFFVFTYGLDSVADALSAFSATTYQQTWAGKIITALIIAGGSKTVNALFTAFGLRNPLQAESQAEEAKRLGRVKVEIKRSKVDPDDVVGVLVDGKMVGSIKAKDTAFPGRFSSGFDVEPGQHTIRVEAFTSKGVAAGQPQQLVPAERQVVVGPGAVIALALDL